MEKQPPIYKRNIGRVHVAVWENSGENGSFLSFDFNRVYRDAEGVFKNTNSFAAADLPALLYLIKSTLSWTESREEVLQ